MAGSLSSFEALYEEKIKGLNDYQNKIDLAEEKVLSFNSKLTKLDSKINERMREYDKFHRESVDVKLSFNAINERVSELEDVHKNYGVSNDLLESSISESENIKLSLNGLIDGKQDVLRQVEDLKKEKLDLSKRLKSKELELDRLVKEKKLTESTDSPKDLKIKTLEGKLKTWNVNYKELKSLVVNLAKKVGYSKHLNMDGDNNSNDENPLIGLISQVKDITSYVEKADLAREEGVIIAEEGESDNKENAEKKARGARKSLPSKSKMKSLFSRGEVKPNEPYWVEDSDTPIIVNSDGEVEDFVQKDSEKEVEIKFIVVESYTPPTKKGFDVKPYIIGAAVTFGLISVMKS